MCFDYWGNDYTKIINDGMEIDVKQLYSLSFLIRSFCKYLLNRTVSAALNN